LPETARRQAFQALLDSRQQATIGFAMADELDPNHKDARGVRLKLHGPLARRHRARIVGAGETVIVFSHGLGSDQSAWREIVARLPGDVTALLYDLPGAGPLLPDAFDPRDYASLANFAEDLLALLEEIGVRRCVYVGHSVSGMIGVLAAIKSPDRFEHLALVNASPRYLNDKGYTGGFDREDLDGLFTAMAANYQGWVAGFAPLAIGVQVPQVIEEFASGLLRMRPDVTLQIARMIFESDVRDILSHLTVPVLLIHSQQDIAVPRAVADYLRSNIRNSHLMWIQSAGHLPHLSAPGQLYEALRNGLLH
jgi:pimeloyl-ACP methyl ester carboxylesterase